MIDTFIGVGLVMVLGCIVGQLIAYLMEWCTKFSRRRKIEKRLLAVLDLKEGSWTASLKTEDGWKKISSSENYVPPTKPVVEPSKVSVPKNTKKEYSSSVGRKKGKSLSPTDKRLKANRDAKKEYVPNLKEFKEPEFREGEHVYHYVSCPNHLEEDKIVLKTGKKYYKCKTCTAWQYAEPVSKSDAPKPHGNMGAVRAKKPKSKGQTEYLNDSPTLFKD